MKRAIRAALRLYPRSWRQRYQAELETLIEDTGDGWAPLPDLLFEAMKIRLTTLNWRFAGAFVLAGLAIATVVSMRQPDHYESTAVLAAQPAPGNSPGAVSDQAERLTASLQSRTSLAMVMQNPDLNLYARERETRPLEDVVEAMREDLTVSAQPDGSIRIAYRGRSPRESRDTVRKLVTRVMEEHQGYQRSMADLASRQPIDPAVAARLALGSRVELSKPPSLPTDRIDTSIWLVAASGLLVGLLAAFAISIVRRNARIWLAVGIAAALTIIPYELALVNNLPLLRYRSQATLITDSPQTVQALIADPAHLLHQADNPNRFHLQFIQSRRKNAFVIQGTYHDRIQVQGAIQMAITNMVNKTKADRVGVDSNKWIVSGPWVEVLDPPTLPIEPLGAAWFTGTIYSGLVLSLVAGLVLFIDSRRIQRPLPEPA